MIDTKNLGYSLNRLLIEKISDDKFRIITSGGTIAYLNYIGIMTLLSAARSVEAPLLSFLHASGLFLSEAEVQQTIQSFINLSLLRTDGQILYHIEPIIKNVQNLPRGACSLSDIAIVVTNQCSFSCPYCYRSNHEEAANLLSVATIKKILREAHDLGAIAVGFTGGEPSIVWRRVAELALYAKNLDFLTITVFTRNVFLGARVIREWAEAGVTHVKLSLEPSWNEKTVVSFVERCRSVGIRVSLGYTFYSENLDLIRRAALLGKRVGIKVRFSPYVPIGKLPPMTPLQITKIWQEVHNLQKSGEGLAEGVSIYEKATGDLPMVCDAGISYAHVEYDGRVGGCPLLTQYYPAGQVMKERGFFDIWSNGDWSLYRDITSINPKCASCPLRPFCVGGCKAMAMARFGDPKMKREPVYCARDGGIV